MAILYSIGIGLPHNEALSVLHMTFAAKSADTNEKALLAMAHRFAIGYFAPKSCAKAVAHYSSAADKIFDHLLPPFQSILSKIEKHHLYDTDDDDSFPELTMFEVHEIFARGGLVFEMVKVGRAYLLGIEEVEQDFELALEYLTDAANNDSGEAHYLLGQFYKNGTSFSPNNYSRSVSHFVRGAELLYPPAISALALAYFDGRGVVKNYTEAYRLFKRASVFGDAEALYHLGVINLEGSLITQDIQLALGYLMMSAEKKYAPAFYRLANIFRLGAGIGTSFPVAPNCEKALKYFKLFSDAYTLNFRNREAFRLLSAGNHSLAVVRFLILAEQGNEDALHILANIFDRHQGLNDFSVKNFTNKTDFLSPEKEEHEYYSRALSFNLRLSEKGSESAMNVAGDYFYYGHGTPKDLAMAANLYYQAGLMGNAQSSFNMAFMYENGYGVVQDFDLARKYLEISLRQAPKGWVAVALAQAKLEAHTWLVLIFSPRSLLLTALENSALVILVCALIFC